jgi:hypothetical protein
MPVLLLEAARYDNWDAHQRRRDMSGLRWRCLAGFLLKVAGVMLAGCQYSYTFEVSGIVQRAADGKPIPGVQIFSLHNVPSGEPAPDEEPVAVTGADGRFSFVETVGDVYFLHGEGKTDWHLFLRKEGFEKESIDLRTVHRPESTKTRVPIFVVVYLLDNK